MTSAHVKAGQAIADLDWQPQTTRPLLVIIFQLLLTQHQPRRIIPLPFFVGISLDLQVARFAQVKPVSVSHQAGPETKLTELSRLTNCQSGSWLTFTILSLSYYGVDRKIKPYGCWRAPSVGRKLSILLGTC